MAQIRAALVLDIVVNDTCNTAEDEHPMMNSNKILTVSYGTFSCTLEGFDDSFGTMKAIAEYFRDLASDDRYFGAEPPQPDAEMLTRIAQREVSRRVQAREQEGKIVLSALEDHSPDAPAQAPVAQAPVAQAPVAQAAPAETPAAAPRTAAQAPVAEEAPAPLKAEIADTAAVATPETPDAPEAAIADTAVMAEPAPAAAPMAHAPSVGIKEDDTSDAEAFFAASPQPQSHYEDEAQTAAAEEVPAANTAPADSIAAKLQRIRAVVAQQDEDDAAGYDEEEAPAAPKTAPVAAEPRTEAQESEAAIAAARRDIEDALQADEATHKADADAEDEEDDLSDILNRLDATEDDEGETAETAESLFDENAEAASEVEAADLPRKGRVIKVKRSDLEAAVARGDLEEVSDETPKKAPAAKAEAKPSSTLSVEDEDELARELAALEAELGGAAPVQEEKTPKPAVEMTEEEAAPAEAEGEDFAPAAEAETTEDAAELAEEEVAPAQAARHSLPTLDDETGPDMSRLMAETDSKMDEPESTTRRDAFAHLRAAVAAKKADEAMGGRATTATSDDAYREDLADVVRPRRPISRPTRTERPNNDARPAPLKLVAEQRIDVDKLRNAGPVRPRRVAAVVEPVKTNPDAESFADFAADMGATKLPELLEAAASYMSFVEGRDQFSRPQLMGKVRSVGLPDFTREDGLRSFGQLLRAGKIEKIKGGRFTVSDEIGYRPDHRAVG
ncbi:lipoprotein, putative [Sulfitobacter indolifex HEL-45]|uniref:Lipoprotein, putative n=1 Tax=Sulfitobacter indolifex HEL-45 TaxID=391624 RepID=A0ABM9X6R4_9RHOB|nr:hypothetical protein [Sulfitobacter indolifex]EDQ05189.1 lipoprotein, putative [Sulfitobacter indolifex HEL-45]